MSIDLLYEEDYSDDGDDEDYDSSGFEISHIEDKPNSPSPLFPPQASGTTGRTAEKTGGLLTLFFVFWNNWC